LILLLGATGQLGSAFRTLLGDSALPLGRNQLDLADTDGIRSALSAYRPEVIVNCAAYTAVDRAEDEEELALRVNALAVGELARFAAEHGIPFVTFSTDYVFDGSATRPYVEGDPPRPLSVYGRTKLAGEQRALQYPGSLVVRTSWVISGTHPNFVATILHKAREGPLRVVDDQLGSPSVAADLAAATRQAMASGVSGLLHLVNQGPASRFELARAALELAGLDPQLVEPCPSTEYPTKAPRPLYSVLGSERVGHLGLAPLPHWRQSLPMVVESLASRF
jgi:dTDP-4-dehydrorhamnose reductase